MTDYERIEKVIHYLEENYLKQPSLHELAQVVSLSESHFHRLFTRWAGVTPKDFLKFMTLEHAKTLLQESKDLLTASYDSGLSSAGRLHDLFVTVEAVTPGEYKTQGEGVTIKYGIHEGPFGKFLIGLTKRGICHLTFFDDEKEALEEMKRKWARSTIVHDHESSEEMAIKVFRPRSKEKIPVLLMGTPFQIKVWEALIKIPEGRLTTYKGVAHAIESPKASRAVGSAVGDNSIAFIIPCHRVIRETGQFSHYRWRPQRKKAIIAWESARLKTL